MNNKYSLSTDSLKRIWSSIGYLQKKIGIADISEISSTLTSIEETLSEQEQVLSLKADLAAVTAGLMGQGAWNAATNTPTLSATPLSIGKFYEVGVGGTSSIPTGGSITYGVGDKLISNGTVWQRIPFTIPITSVPIGKNLFNAASVATGFYVDGSTGALAAFGAAVASDFIAVSPSTTYKISGFGNIHHGVGIVYLTEAKTTISAAFVVAIDAAESSVVTTPALCKFIRFTVKTTKSGDNTLASKSGYLVLI